MVFGICTPVKLLPSIYDPKREWRGVSAGTRDWGLDLQPPLYLDFGDYARTVSRGLVYTKNLKESNRRQQQAAQSGKIKGPEGTDITGAGEGPWTALGPGSSQSSLLSFLCGPLDVSRWP